MSNELVFEMGDTIIRPGIISPGAYIIASGRVRRECNGDFSSLTVGDFFGEEGAIINAPSTYTIIAVESTTLHRFDFKELLDILHDDRELLQRVIGKFASASWHGEQGDRNEQMMFIFALFEQLFDREEKSGEIPLTTVVDHLGIPEKVVISLVEQIAFEEGAFVSIRDTTLLFSKEKIDSFLSRRRKELFINTRINHNIGGQKGIGEFTLLQTALKNR